uniref:Macrodomain protein n=1 Tax=Clandestinovirus TaxID=2831644 RepID=A0A8F8KKW2_9VIRU|nr:macrodomain protein [Clandestinovirus]
MIEWFTMINDGKSGAMNNENQNIHCCYLPYATACIDGTLTVGNMLPILMSDGKWMLNLATQDRIGGKYARLEWVKSSLIQAFDFCKTNNIERFALPRIGSGLGGLPWEKVKTIIEEVAALYPEVKVEVWSLPVKLIAINKK